MPENTPRLVCHQLKKHYLSNNKKITILDDVSLSVPAGQSVALMGTSGAGKSTLLSILAGLEKADSGKVQLLQQDIMPMDEDQRARLRCGQVAFVFQSFQLMQGFSALQNVLMPLQIAFKANKLKMNKAEMQQKAMQVLQQVGLEGRAGHLAEKLSGGEQQRVALARAFVIEPKVLFADEPTGNLDQKTGEKVIDLMFSLQKQYQTSLLMVTHDAPLAQRCDRLYYLDQGKLYKKQP